jgi:cell division protein FtsL
VTQRRQDVLRRPRKLFAKGLRLLLVIVVIIVVVIVVIILTKKWP